MKLPSIIIISLLGAGAISIKFFLEDFILGLIYFFPILIGLFIGLGGLKHFKGKERVLTNKTATEKPDSNDKKES